MLLTVMRSAMEFPVSLFVIYGVNMSVKSFLKDKYPNNVIEGTINNERYCYAVFSNSLMPNTLEAVEATVDFVLIEEKINFTINEQIAFCFVDLRGITDLDVWFLDCFLEILSRFKNKSDYPMIVLIVDSEKLLRVINYWAKVNQEKVWVILKNKYKFSYLTGGSAGYEEQIITAIKNNNGFASSRVLFEKLEGKIDRGSISTYLTRMTKNKIVFRVPDEEKRKGVNKKGFVYYLPTWECFMDAQQARLTRN